MKKLEASSAPLPLPGGLAKRLVLYVEDEESNREITELRLGNEFQFLWATDAREACDLVQRHKDKLHAILMDIQLKGSELDGIELTRLLRGEKVANAPAYATDLPVLDVPILFVTAYGKRYTREQLLARGGTHLIDKPIDFMGLALALASARARRSAAGRVGVGRGSESGTVRDAQTGLFNRRHLEATLHSAMHAGQGIGLLLLELDGEPWEGSLRQLAHIVLSDSASVRARGRLVDVPCRFADDSLGILVPGAAREALVERAESARAAVERFFFAGGARATVSLGAAFFPGHGTTKEALIEAATAALSAAKRAGGNRLEIASP